MIIMRPFRVVETPGFIVIEDGAGTRVANMRTGFSPSDSEIIGVANRMVIALNRSAEFPQAAVAP